ncbi:cyclin-dependent kinase-activating kinase assembly factor-related / CDK-activating kinase assembly factor-like protein [Arabidopsis thaliana]|jgi:CDK-activating kinase assembly factor MAT1|uniref:Cyclin-dependent kinase-activating kinase assembly factor-related / CDK-activating kinase assembly factor-like protein n=2 Tax=Arabidopsis thaliana TaxID=3702 RepID=A0A1P8B3T8_ARATH|nr:cyclin-dependent kinase-activating kinase assembly factor-related / CDK-activating kinase assembly factor-like protein [Arabidopsis thaliana]NP_001328153.1 cyclin-dependent kinase-activating kinase assembly factor-related / CDK-activating kinase assembly factor-like protein [Arabidopsis thaliana]ANM66232.1 cyclin-dependent kinase-activating kinase assembly factor-related / CDK-activating kinase assembly factor-like protein [Arabidopsis thaliana]ANM66244.1 cyclin-dependent kinase-activating ki|eukprot:NP_001328141.1 cyclin-dependent kinase-activating kinase assembly factor-related / CDK-activating kinase assembly factor-like protein [Arabidopsis thaliana]
MSEGESLRYTIDGKRSFHHLKTTMTTWKKWSAWVSFTCAPYFLYSCKTRPMYILPSIPPVFDLIDGINVEAIEQKIKRYSKENAEQIMINRARKAEELTAALAACKAKPPQTDADTSSNHGVTAGTTYGQASRPTGMGPQPVPIVGGAERQHYAMEDEATRRMKAERAGGFSLEISKRRALEEAFASIWV